MERHCTSRDRWRQALSSPAVARGQHPLYWGRWLLAFLRRLLRLSEVTHKDFYALPRIYDALNDIAGSRWLRLLNLCEATGKYS